MSILEDLFFGNINGLENEIRKNEEYLAIVENIDKEFNYFKELLDDEQYKHIDKLEGLLGQMHLFYSTDTFRQGFKIGAKIMLEVLQKDI